MRTDPARIISPVIAVVTATLWHWRLLRTGQDESNVPAVTLEEDPSSFTLSNGIITARVSKRSGDLTSLQYKGLETLTDKSGHAGGYWSHDTTGGKETIARVTIDPRTNGGERGEVSVKGISGGLKMGHGPGAAAGGDFPADIEIRYCLGRGESGVYTYCAFDHHARLSGGHDDRGPLLHKLADMFDWMTLDAKRNQHFPADLREGDKYIYTAVQFEHPVYGWSSTTKNVGFWLINPSRRVPERRTDEGRVPLPPRYDAGGRPVRAQLLAEQPLWRRCRGGRRRRALDESDRPLLAVREFRRRSAGDVERCTSSVAPGNREVAVRLGRRRRLSAPQRASNGARAARADRPADARSEDRRTCLSA